MKVDAPFPQAPVAAPPVRPVPQSGEQTSARPVDRPHHDEATENREQQHNVPTGESHQAARPHDADDRGRRSADRDDSAAPQQSQPRNATEPSKVGELLDVLA